jgi:hypothetical protein
MTTYLHWLAAALALLGIYAGSWKGKYAEGAYMIALALWVTP